MIRNPLPTQVSYTSIIGSGTPVILFGDDGDGLVSATSQDLGRIPHRPGLIHRAIRINIERCYRLPLLPEETHTCETEDQGVWAELLKQLGPSIRGDLNGDGIVNSLDWSIMSSKWLQPDPGRADLNGDGIVNSLDYSIMNANWLRTVP